MKSSCFLAFIILFPALPQTLFLENALRIVLDVLHRIFLDGLVLYGGIEVVEHSVEFDATVLDGFEAQQGVVDAAQLAGGDEDKRVLFLCDVVYRQKIFGDVTIRPPAPSTSTVS